MLVPTAIGPYTMNPARAHSSREPRTYRNIHEWSSRIPLHENDNYCNK